MLVCLEGPDFTATPFQRLPAEAQPGATAHEIEDQRARIRQDILPLRDADLIEALHGDDDLFALFRDLGPDLTITAYAFNFVSAEGPNRDPALMNEMNDLIKRRLSLQSFNRGSVPTQPMFVTASEFDPAHFGLALVSDFCRRAGCDPQEGLPMGFLTSTAQNTWLSQAGGGRMLHSLRDALSDTATAATIRPTGSFCRTLKAICSPFPNWPAGGPVLSRPDLSGPAALFPPRRGRPPFLSLEPRPRAPSADRLHRRGRLDRPVPPFRASPDPT